MTLGRKSVVKTKSGRDACNSNFEGSKVCVENYSSRPDGIHACNIKISKMNEDLVGDWGIQVKKDRNTEDVEAELSHW